MTANSMIVVSITDLMRETGIAYFDATNNPSKRDPEWPIWFAEHLAEPLSGLFGIEFTKSQLVFCLITAEHERNATQPDADWPSFYAEYFVARFARTDTPKEDKLALYIIPSCPFCRFVINALDRLDIDIELRDITSNSDHYQSLMDARQRTTVPVLRIDSPNGKSRWMPESRDIVDYLMKTYG